MLERVWESAVVCERVPLGSVSWSQLSSESVYHFGACLRVSMLCGVRQVTAAPLTVRSMLTNFMITCMEVLAPSSETRTR